MIVTTNAINFRLVVKVLLSFLFLESAFLGAAFFIGDGWVDWLTAYPGSWTRRGAEQVRSGDVEEGGFKLMIESTSKETPGELPHTIAYETRIPPSPSISQPSSTEPPPFELPSEIVHWPQDYTHRPPDSSWCREKYSLDYIASLRDHHETYCPSFECFKTQINPERFDTFCVARNALLTHTDSSVSFDVACDGRIPNDPWTLPPYMYDTGPGEMLRRHFSFNKIDREHEERRKRCGGVDEKAKFTVAIRREGVGNLWHSLMEIFSFYLTIDALFISPRGSSNKLQLTDDDIPSIQLIFVDGHGDGPYIDLWKLFAPLPIIHASSSPLKSPLPQIKKDDPLCLENVILPLAGGSNPLWREDWSATPCSYSELLNVFSERIVSHYAAPSIMASGDESSSELVLTFINRASTRKLLNSAHLLSRLQNHFPSSLLKIQSIDFATIPFSEQLRIIQQTDVLVGVHGAGLSHAIFLREGSSVVEILPHGMDYKLFRNLAKLRGCTYVRAHGDQAEGEGDWQDLDVKMSTERFVELVKIGVGVVLNQGTRIGDAV